MSFTSPSLFLKNIKFLVLERFQRYINQQINKYNDSYKLEIQTIYSAKSQGFNVKDCTGYYQLTNKNTKLFIRKNTSDILSFRQVFLDFGYQKAYEIAKANHLKINTIMDGGANVGYASLLFLDYFPKSKIYAIEPEETNYQILKENLATKNAIVIQMGIWHKKDTLNINRSFRDGKNWSVSLVKISNDDAKSEVDTIAKIKRSYGINQIDFLKLDIEGAEYNIFIHDTEFDLILKEIQLIAIEIHEELGDPSFIISKLVDNGFLLIQDGETVFGYKNK